MLKILLKLIYYQKIILLNLHLSIYNIAAFKCSSCKLNKIIHNDIFSICTSFFSVFRDISFYNALTSADDTVN